MSIAKKASSTLYCSVLLSCSFTLLSRQLGTRGIKKYFFVDKIGIIIYIISVIFIYNTKVLIE